MKRLIALMLMALVVPVLTLSGAPTRPAPPSFPVAEMQIPPIVNPNGLAFTPSADDTAAENGGPLVTKYTVELFKTTAPTTVVKTIDLGKPALVAGEVQWMGMAAIRVTLVPGNYVANVYAEGPGGRSDPAVSDPFTVVPRKAGAAGKPRWIQ